MEINWEWMNEFTIASKWSKLNSYGIWNPTLYICGYKLKLKTEYWQPNWIVQDEMN